MEKEKHMNTHRPLVPSVVLSLVVGLMGGLLWGSTPAHAQAFSHVISFAGTVTGLGGEDVPLSGQARITSPPVLEPPATAPSGAILTIDIINAHGKGTITNKPYVALGTDKVYRTMLLDPPSGAVEYTFPFFLNGTGRKATDPVAVALVSFPLTFDTRTGAITVGSGTLSTPNFGQ